MPRGGDLNDFTRGQIFALRFHAGWDLKRIAHVLGVNYECVKKYCQRSSAKATAHQQAPTARKGRCGRHRCTTARTDRAMVHPVMLDPFCNASSVKRQLLDITNCSVETVRRRLDEGGYKRFVPARKTLLHPQHIVSRLQWSINHLAWTVEQWRMVLFTDESKFVICRHHPQHVRRRIGQRYKEENVVPQGNRGIGSVMIWAGFSHLGYTDVVTMEGNFNADDYNNLLLNHLIPRYDALVPRGGYLMQDNAPIHTAIRTRQFLEQHQVQVLPWPSMSPDMNPIENVWALLKSDLSRQRVENADQLSAAIRDVWRTKMASQEFRDRLIDSMVARVRSLHIVRGSYTKY